jgi:TolB-like protein/DNA-binding winged helix-turn-helix (wHTH) protein/tetratricopeptide (TPR) repeat protein
LSNSTDLPRRLRFDHFELDLRTTEIYRDGKQIKLQEQPYQVLVLLIERAGDLVSREDLRKRLWPNDTFVDFDHGVNIAVNKLRDALGDSTEKPRYIETLPRRGYRFIGAVETIPSTAGQDLIVHTERATEEPPKVLAAHHSPKVWIVAGALGAILVLFVGMNARGLRSRFTRPSIARPIRSLAVLPLENMSGDPNQDFFADGMTEALITDLGKIGGIGVISRTSAMHYKGTRKTLPEIARELNVDAVVEGAVVRSGSQVRITAQLIDASTDRHLWSESYERDFRDVLTLQSDVACDIASEVKVKLTRQEKARLASSRPIDPEAQEAYMKGRYEYNKWTREGLEKSLEYFQQAIQRDPDFAQAWAGLSDTYYALESQGLCPRQDCGNKRSEAAEKAVELDETLSNAHLALLDDEDVQRAILLDPSNVRAHLFHGRHLLLSGQIDGAMAEVKRALQLDPLNPQLRTHAGVTFYYAGRYDEAIEQFHQVSDPDLYSGKRHRILAEIYDRKGMQKEAVAEYVTALKFRGDEDLAARVQRTYVSSGYAAAKKTLLWGEIGEGEKRAKGDTLPENAAWILQNAVWVAGDYAILGQKDKAFEWLNKALNEGSWGLEEVKLDDRFVSVRSDPRFQDLLRQIPL